MSDMIAVPRVVWERMQNDVAFIKQAILPLARGFKQPEWMTAAEVQEYLGIGASRLKQLRGENKFRLQKPVGGRNIKYLRKDVEAYQEGH